MAIEDRNLKPGTKLVARYKTQDYTCNVVETEDGIRFRLPDGKEFKSISSAGSEVMGGIACNGWRFWSVEGQSETQAPYETSKPKPSNGAKKPTPARRKKDKGPDQPQVAPGAADSETTAEEQASRSPSGQLRGREHRARCSLSSEAIILRPEFPGAVNWTGSAMYNPAA